MTGARIVFLLILAAAGARAEPPAVPVSTEPGWLPYRFEILASGGHYARRGSWVTGFRHLDLDGDGYADHFRNVGPGINAVIVQSRGMHELWQHNYEPRFVWDEPPVSVEGLWDVDEDGDRELVTMVSTEDGSLWRITVLDAWSGVRERFFDLPGGEDLRGDGGWDGRRGVFGVLAVPTADGPRPGLVVVSEAGFDLEPRGVLAIDAVSGDELWSYAVGPKPLGSTVHVVDLDGDGATEVVFAGSGVSNLGGREINGTSDDHAMLFVLEADGSLRWSQRIGSAPAGAAIEVFDVDRDGRPEIICAGRVAGSRRGLIRILDPGGRTLASAEVESMVSSLGIGRGGDGECYIYGALGAREIRRFHALPEALVLDRVATFEVNVRIVAVSGMVPEAGDQVLVGSTGDHVWLLADDLRPLARLEDDRVWLTGNTIEVYDRQDDGRHIYSMGSEQRPASLLKLVPVPRPVPWAPLAAGGGVAAAATAMIVARRRRRSAAPLRELRLQLLGRLELSGHGAIGALSSLRRFAWHAEAVLQGFDADDRVLATLRGLGGDALTVGLPNLRGMVVLAELAGLEDKLTTAVRDQTERLEAVMGAIMDDGCSAEALGNHREELVAVLADAENRFRDLRRAVEREFAADPRPIVERSLAAHEADIQSEGVTVSVAQTPAPACRIDEEELAFVLDNLVENAVRAMRGSPRRALTLDWRTTGGHAVITATDTGCGMAPDEVEAAFAPGPGKRAGGGLGLPRSREIVRKYGGTLTVKESRPGGGTTMVLMLPLAATEA